VSLVRQTIRNGTVNSIRGTGLPATTASSVRRAISARAAPAKAGLSGNARTVSTHSPNSAFSGSATHGAAAAACLQERERLAIPATISISVLPTGATAMDLALAPSAARPAPP
jgi:hypothetical protein